MSEEPFNWMKVGRLRAGEPESWEADRDLRLEPVPHFKDREDPTPLPRTSIQVYPRSLWAIGLVVFVAAILGVVVGELAIWLGGQWLDFGATPTTVVGV